jgi:hypothetical protein
VRTVIGILWIMGALCQAASAASAPSCFKATFLEFTPLSSSATVQVAGPKKELWHVLGGSEQVAVFNWRPLDVVTICPTGVDGIATITDASDTPDTPVHARKVPAK